MQPAMVVGEGTQEVDCERFIELAENSVNNLRVFVYQAGVSDSGDQRRGHDTIGVMIQLQKVAQFVHHDGEQVHSILLALVARPEELGIVARCCINEPAPAGGIAIERDRVAAGQAQICPAQVRQRDLHASQLRQISAERTPAGLGLGDNRLQQLLQKFVVAPIGDHVQERTTAEIRKEPVDPRTTGQPVLTEIIVDRC